MPLISPAHLHDFARRLLLAAGATEAESQIVAESLIDANLRGHDSHGVYRLFDYVDQLRSGETVPGAALTILDEGPSRIVADGARGFGQVQCRRLIERLLPKAREQGLACAAMRQSGHVGRLGEWVERLSAAGCAALLAVNDNGVPQSVAPPGGLCGRYSTNPIALAVPTASDPLVLDFSTSAVANGKVSVARMAGQSCPPGWLQDAQGNPTTDPHVMKADPPGALLPFGGDQSYKAFGLAVLFDVLISGLSGGLCPPGLPDSLEHNNVLLIAWDPGRWSGHAHFHQEAERFISHLRATPTRPGETIRLPGDQSRQNLLDRQANGIPIPEPIWKALHDLFSELST